MSASAEAVAPELGFFCVGLNHETSPLEVRDALVLSDEEVARAIRALRERAGASEALVISTCNRTEVYAVASDPVAAESTVLGMLARRAAHVMAFGIDAG